MPNSLFRRFVNETSESIASLPVQKRSNDLSKNLAMDPITGQLSKLLERLKDRIRKRSVNSLRPLIRMNQWDNYLRKHWFEVSDFNKKHILDCIEKALKNESEMPSLYDLIGLSSERDRVPSWPVQIEDSTFDDALKDLQYGTNSNKALNLRIQLIGSDLWKRWDRFPAWAQVECLGYTEWGGREMLRVRGQYRVEDFRIQNSGANEEMAEACPTLEHYRKILEWEGAPTSFLDIIQSEALPGTHVAISPYTPVRRPPGLASGTVRASRRTNPTSSTAPGYHHRPIQLSWEKPITPETYSQTLAHSPSQSPPPVCRQQEHHHRDDSEPVEYNWDLRWNPEFD